jgi:hypothetical protein
MKGLRILFSPINYREVCALCAKNMTTYRSIKTSFIIEKISKIFRSGFESIWWNPEHYFFVQIRGWYGIYKICKGSMEAHFDNSKFWVLFFYRKARSSTIRLSKNDRNIIHYSVTSAFKQRKLQYLGHVVLLGLGGLHTG